MFGSLGSSTSRGWRFRLLGFPVRVDLSFWIMAAVLGLRGGDAGLLAIWIGVVFVSILAHELGHAAAGRAFGLRGQIELYSMGGMTTWSAPHRLRYGQDILVSLAGPATGLAIGGAVWAVTHVVPLNGAFHVRVLIAYLLWVNIGWSLLNLLPLRPLDGGHVMTSAIHWVRGYENEALPILISVVVASAAVAAALLYRMFWAALLAAWFAFQNIRLARQQEHVAPRDMRIAKVVLLVVGAAVVALVIARQRGIL